MTPVVRQALARPGWVLPYNPDLQFDFARAAAWKGTGTGGGAVVPAESLLTVSRASTTMIDDSNGMWRTFQAATLAMSNKGVAVWEARTNLALWSRDLTNAAWVKVTMTTALTATGIDGTANSATTITAAGAASTILQTVVQASTADTVSFFVRRRTGTGTIEVTGNGFVGATDITAALASAAIATPGGWYRAVVSATLVNPVLGLRITTSGDAVDVDFGQLEAGTFVTPPILTTTVAVLRAASVVTVTTSLPFSNDVYSLFAKGIPYGTGGTIFAVDDGSLAHRYGLSRSSGLLFTIAGVAASVAFWNATSGTWSTGVSAKRAAGIATADRITYSDGANVLTNTSASVPAGITKIGIGSVAAAGLWNGFVEVTALSYRRRLLNEELRDISR